MDRGCCKKRILRFLFAAAPSDYDQGEWRMKIRLIATDMDGTFLDDEKQIPGARYGGSPTGSGRFRESAMP